MLANELRTEVTCITSSLDHLIAAVRPPQRSFSPAVVSVAIPNDSSSIILVLKVRMTWGGALHSTCDEQERSPCYYHPLGFAGCLLLKHNLVPSYSKGDLQITCIDLTWEVVRDTDCWVY